MGVASEDRSSSLPANSSSISIPLGPPPTGVLWRGSNTLPSGRANFFKALWQRSTEVKKQQRCN